MPPAQVLLPRFVRIRVEGRDRTRFIHNFCTNDVKVLQPGSACEAFFTDVRARILAHGWILVAADFLELWMLSDDAAPLLKHLRRYIIADDVEVCSAPEDTAALAVFGSESARLLKEIFGGSTELPQPNHWCRISPDDPSGGPIAMLQLCWAETPVSILSIGSEQMAEVRQRLTSGGIRSADAAEFERLRIRERIPLWGTDLTAEHLAPEAARNAAAISYVKGCYLGQEPIARLDALGHVNRSLHAIQCDAAPEVCRNGTVHLERVGAIGRLTSVCADEGDVGTIGLAVLRTHALDLSSGLTVVTPEGVVAGARLCR